MKVVSTFAGCGGSSLGYEQADCEVVASIEWDDHAVACYKANHPDTHMFHEDIAKVTGAAILEVTGLAKGELDILDGSPPCQGFSTAGLRVLDDDRNALFREHMRLIDELEPKHVIIENVAGMISGKMRPVAGEIVADLKSRGYKVAAGLMQASYFGVGQLRARTFFIASRLGQPELPRPISRPVKARTALRGVDPGPIPLITSATERACAHLLLPGEKGPGMFKRLGYKGEDGKDKDGWFNRLKLHPDRPANTFTKMPRLHYHWESRLVTIPEALVLTGFPVDYKLPTTPGCTVRQEYDHPWMRIGNSVAPPMTREIVKQSLAPLG